MYVSERETERERKRGGERDNNIAKFFILWTQRKGSIIRILFLRKQKKLDFSYSNKVWMWIFVAAIELLINFIDYIIINYIYLLTIWLYLLTLVTILLS